MTNNQSINLMTISIPGYFQMLERKYLHGIIIFTLTFASIASIVARYHFFKPNPIFDITLSIVICLSILWHLLYVIKTITTVKPSLKNMTEDELYEKARMAFLKSNLELAEIMFKELLNKNPKDDDVTHQLFKIYVENNDIKNAKKMAGHYKNNCGKKWLKEIEQSLKNLDPA